MYNIIFATPADERLTDLPASPEQSVTDTKQIKVVLNSLLPYKPMIRSEIVILILDFSQR